MNKGYPNIVYADFKIAKALSRYLIFRLSFEKIFLNPLKDPFRFSDSLEMAEKSDFLLIDAFIDREFLGFQFASQIGKKTLLLLYPDELDIEYEGPLWLVLPFKLNRLGEKVKEMMNKSTAMSTEYEKLEKRFTALRESKRHLI